MGFSLGGWNNPSPTYYDLKTHQHTRSSQELIHANQTPHRPDNLIPFYRLLSSPSVTQVNPPYKLKAKY